MSTSRRSAAARARAATVVTPAQLLATIGLLIVAVSATSTIPSTWRDVTLVAVAAAPDRPTGATPLADCADQDPAPDRSTIVIRPESATEVCVRLPFDALWSIDLVGGDQAPESAPVLWSLDDGEPIPWGSTPRPVRQLASGDHRVRFHSRDGGNSIDRIVFAAVPVKQECRLDGQRVPTVLDQVECDALVALFDATGGNGWHERRGWGTGTDPCTWAGVTCGHANVRGLLLGSNRLTGSLPPEIGDLRLLRTLDVGHNELASIPPHIGNLSILFALDVAGNRLRSLPPEIGELAELFRLDASDNRLTRVPVEIRNHDRLHRLALTGNPLRRSPGCVDQSDLGTDPGGNGCD